MLYATGPAWSASALFHIKRDTTPLAFPIRSAILTRLSGSRQASFGMKTRVRLFDARVDCDDLPGVVRDELDTSDIHHELLLGFMERPGAVSPGIYDLRGDVGSCSVDGGVCNPDGAVVLVGGGIVGDGGVVNWDAREGTITVVDAGPNHLEASLDLQLTIDGGEPRRLAGVIDATLCVPDAG